VVGTHQRLLNAELRNISAKNILQTAQPKKSSLLFGLQAWASSTQIYSLFCLTTVQQVSTQEDILLGELILCFYHSRSGSIHYLSVTNEDALISWVTDFLRLSSLSCT
jgi:hypothetical protein